MKYAVLLLQEKQHNKTDPLNLANRSTTDLGVRRRDLSSTERSWKPTWEKQVK